MTIESKLATVLQPASGAHPASKAAAGASAGATGGQGFAGLVSALSAQDVEDVALVALAQPGPVLLGEEQNMPPTFDEEAQDDTNFIANMVLQSAALPSLVAAQVLPESDGVLPTLPLEETAQPHAAVGQADSGVLEPVLAGEDVKSKPFLSASGQDPKSVSASASQQANQPTAVLQAQARIVVLPLPVADLARPPADSSKPKSLAGYGSVDGLVSAPGLFDRWGISPTYVVVQASAVVPDAQVAETVSYWVTHGVQKAELTLDGLGSEPVEVQISVDGDQTRVDFRTSQVDVRQAIESAAGQLKSLLASEGLQLQGMSVGTSAKGNNPGEGRQGRFASAQQTQVVGVETIGAVHHRVANTPVGRALDLYV